MGVKWQTKKNNFPKVEASIRQLNGKKVSVGVLEGEHAWLAGIHEYGLNIEVTPAMRAYLHRQGLHLKKSTTHIKIPERAFLRNGYDENKDDVLDKAEALLGDVLGGTMSANMLFETIGLLLSSKIKDYATDLSSPANHPFTIERKGSSNPLVGGSDDSGSLIGGITYKVE